MALIPLKKRLAEYSKKTDFEEEVMPPKKLKLIKKTYQPTSTISLVTQAINQLSKTKTSNEILQILLQIAESTSVLGSNDFNNDATPLLSSTIQDTELSNCIKKLLEHFKVEAESSVRAKIIGLFVELSELAGCDILGLIESVIDLMKGETSHKVLAQALRLFLQLGKNIGPLYPKLVQVAKENLKDTSSSVKCHSLEIIGVMLPTSERIIDDTVHTVLVFTRHADARVRSAAFNTLIQLHERKQLLGIPFYNQAIEGLKDDYEIVKLSALKLIRLLAGAYGEEMVMVKGESIRLTDDAFSKICLMVTDLSMRVRTLAITILGDMKSVSPKLLHQTLDKKLMSNMRLKLSAHERSKENVASGEWATGAKWADDAPRELLHAESISLIASGSCGALVHALEDEFQEVRIAGVDTLCSLSLEHPEFAMLSLDFLVDMFNDEIEEVRLRAIESLCRINKHIVLREDQLETILGVLKDFSMEVREGLHRVLSSCSLSTKDCLQMAVEDLLDNLKKYPQDKKSIWRCVQQMGARHPELTLPLVPELLAIHPFFDTPEPDCEDPLYICVLILIFNAASNCPTMVALFEEHTLKHYRYLRDTMTQFVPYLKIGERDNPVEIPKESSNKSIFFLIGMMHSVAKAPNARSQLHLMETSKKDLMRIADADPSLGGAPAFLANFVHAQLLIQKILNDKFAALSAYEPNTSIKLHQIALQLQYSFTSLTPTQKAATYQLKLQALSIRLVKVVKGNSSALSICHHLLNVVEQTQRFLLENGIPPDPWTTELFKELYSLEDNKPGIVARLLSGLIRSMKPMAPPPCHEFNIGQCKAKISAESYGDPECPLTFTAGLVLGIPVDAEILSLSNPQLLRIRVKYPDLHCALILPNRSHLRPLKMTDQFANENDFRLLTRVLLSHQVWTEPCYVDLSLVLDLSSEEGMVHVSRNVTDIDPYVIDLCKPVKVYISPKAVKRGV